jgi:hypothetical protein
MPVPRLRLHSIRFHAVLAPRHRSADAGAAAAECSMSRELAAFMTGRGSPDRARWRNRDFLDRMEAAVSYSAFVEARDFLLARRTGYETAFRNFEWPRLTTFNGALDYFDVMARGNGTLALWVVNEDGSQQMLPLAEMAKRSNQVANWLRKQGVERGDRILVMLGNEVLLWDTMLASI